eukprot:896109-Pleurochrysis_carterae.AAC.1
MRAAEGQWRTAVKGMSGFSAAAGAIRLPWERRDARESGGARRRRRCVRERFCGDGLWASARQTSETCPSLLSIDECFIPAAARP